jgi:glycosyltransferase involved in cell wall biosynthesis
MEVSVVFPVYNECANLEPLYEETRAILERNYDEWEMIFVDDGSTDGSREKLRNLHDSNSRVKVCYFSSNFGQSAALDAGMKRATGQVIVTMDADRQNDPNDVPKLVTKLTEDDLDCVVGWRRHRKDSIRKKLSSRLAHYLRRYFLGTELHDYGCTLKAFTWEAANAINIKGEMHRYIPPMLRWRGYDVDEVVVNHRPRPEGETKYSWRRLPKGFLDMMNVWFWQKYHARPLHIFGGLGVLSGVVGFLGLAYAVYLKVFQSVSLSDTALPLFAIFMTFLGVQFFVSGLLADISVRNYFEIRGSSGYRIAEVLEQPDGAQYSHSSEDGARAITMDSKESRHSQESQKGQESLDHEASKKSL